MWRGSRASMHDKKFPFPLLPFSKWHWKKGFNPTKAWLTEL